MARADVSQDENFLESACVCADGRTARNSRISRVPVRGTKRKRKKTPSGILARTRRLWLPLLLFIRTPRPWHKFNSFRPIGPGTLKETPFSAARSTIFSRGIRVARVRAHNEPLIANPHFHSRTSHAGAASSQVNESVISVMLRFLPSSSPDRGSHSMEGSNCCIPAGCVLARCACFVRGEILAMALDNI